MRQYFPKFINFFPLIIKSSTKSSSLFSATSVSPDPPSTHSQSYYFPLSTHKTHNGVSQVCKKHSNVTEHQSLTSRPKNTNPRGIPEAPFIEKVESIIKDPETEFKPAMTAFQDRLQQYKYMELSKQQQLADLKLKIPDIEKNLAVISHIKLLKDSGEEKLETNYELDSTLYTKAEVNVENLESVCLWLGADVMLEYPLDEAVELLEVRLTNNTEQLKTIEEDLDFLRQNITTMEVNTARLYNWDVERMKNMKAVEQNTKELKI